MNRVKLLLTTAVAICLLNSILRAADSTWSSTSDTNWGTAANWSNGVPGISGGGSTSTDIASFITATATLPKLTVSAVNTTFNIGGIKFGTSGATPSTFTIGTTGLTATPIQLSPNATIQYVAGATGTVTQTIAQPIQFMGSPINYTNNTTGTSILNFTGASSGGAGSGAVTLTLSGSGTGTNAISGIISNGSATSVAIVVNSGIWNVTSASNSYSGGVTINGGTFSCNSHNTAGLNQPLGTNATLNLNGGTFQSPTAGNISTNVAAPTINIGPNGGTIDTRTGFLFYGGALGGSGNLRVITSNNINSAWLLYTGTSPSYTGNITIGNGTNTNCGIQYRSNKATPFGTATITVLSGGIMSADSGAVSLNNNIILNGGRLGSQVGAPAFNYTGGITLQGLSSILGNPQNPADTNLMTVSGVISGTGSFTKDGATTITLSGANTFSGSFTNTAGAVVLANPLALQNATYTAGAGALTFDSTAGPSFTLGGLAGTSGGLVLQDNLAAPIALSVGNNNANASYSGIISGAGGLVKIGTGTQTLAGANTYTGNTQIAAGTLQFSSAAAQTLSGVISGAGNLVKDSTGTLTLSGANKYTGATTVTGGKLNIASGGSNVSPITVNTGGTIGGAGSVTNLTINGGGISLDPANPDAALTVANVSIAPMTQVSFDTPPPVGVTTGTVLYYTGATPGIANLLTSGNRMTFMDDTVNKKIVYSITTGTRTWSATVPGNWNLLGDTNWLEGDNKFANGDVAILDDTAKNGDVTVVGTIVPASVTFNNSGTPYNLSGIGAIAGVTTLVKNGTGTATIATPNTYTGATTVNSGVLNIQNGGALGSTSSGTTVAAGAALQVQGGITTAAEPLTISGGGINANGVLRNISGANILPGLVTLSGTDARINSDAGSLTLSNTGTITGAGIPLSVGGAGNTTINSILGIGAGTVTKDGTGTLISTAANTYTGATTISAGTLQLGSGTANGTTANSTYSIAAGARLFLNYATAVTQTWSKFTGAGTLELQSAQGANGTAFWNPTNLTLPAAFTGTLQLDTGRVNCNPTGLGGTTNFVINNGGQFLAFDNTTNSYTYPQNFTISGLGFGEAGQNLGTIRVSLQNATFTGNIALAGNSGLYTQAAGGQTGMNVTGVISDGASTFGLSIASQGPNPITLSGANIYKGDTTFLTLGTLNLNHQNALQNSTLVTTGGTATTFNPAVSGNAFTLGGLGGSVAVSLQNTATTPIALSVGNNNANTVFSGALTGAGSLVKIGTGTLTLSGVSTYAGATTVSAGTLQLGGAGQLGGGTYAGAINNNAILQFNSTANQTFSGAISGSGALTKDGTGTLTLSGDSVAIATTNVNTGTLAVSGNAAVLGAATIGAAGTLEVAGAGTLAPPSNISNGGTLKYSSSAAQVFSGLISGAGGVTKDTSATGVLSLTKANTYTGPTAVSAGQLVIDRSGANTGALGDSAVSVNAGGTLVAKGNATIGSTAAGALTVGAAGNLTFQDGAINTVTTTGNVSFNANSMLTFDVGSTSGAADKLVVGGTVAVSGPVTINLSILTTLANGSSSYTLISAPNGGLPAGGAGFVIGTLPAGFNSFSLATSTSTALILTLTATSTPATTYWTGLASSTGIPADAANNWSYGSTLTPAKSNWSTTINGTTDPVQVPGAISDVFFTAANASSTAGALLTKIDGLYSVKSLTFDTSPQTTAPITSVVIDTNSNLLTLGSGGLIVTAANPASVTLSGTAGAVQVGADQTWALNSNTKPFVVSAPINGTAGTAATQTLTLGGTGTGGVTLSGAIGNGSGGGKLALRFNQPGTTTISANNTFTGGAILHSGTVIAGNTGAFNSTAPNAITFDASSTGKLQAAGLSLALGGINSNAVLGTPIIENGAAGAVTLTASSTGTDSFGGVIRDGGAGALAFVMGGTGVQTLTGANTYSAGTTLNSGTLGFNSGSLGTIGTIGMNGGALRWNGTNTQDLSARISIVDGKSGVFDTNGNAVTFAAAPLAVTGGLTKAGAGTLTLAAANTYTGATSVTGGTLQIGGSGSLNSGIYAGGIALGAGAGLQFSSSAPQTLSGIISGAGTLTKDTDAGTLILTGVNTYSGNTTINTGALQLGTGAVNGTPGTTTYSIASDAKLYLNYLTAVGPTWAKITGAGTLELNSAQAVTGLANWCTGGALALPAGFTGTLLLDKGRVEGTPAGLGGMTTFVIRDGAQFLAFDNTLLGTAYTFPQNFSISGMGFGELGYNSGALRVSGLKATFTGNVVLTGPAGLYVQQGSNGNMNVTGVISDNGAGFPLTINGFTTFVTLSGANTYSGSTTIPATSTLKLGNAAAIPSGAGKGNVSLIGTLDLNGFSGTVNGFSGSGVVVSTAAAAATLTVGGNDQSGAFTGVIQNGTATATGFTKIGSGTQTLSGANSFGGQLTVQNGTLSVPTLNNAGANGPLGNGALPIILGGTGGQTGVLGYTGGSVANNRNFTLATGGTGGFQIDNAASVVTLSGLIDGAGGVAKSGAGALILAGANTYSGATALNGGIAQVQSAELPGSGPFGNAGTISFGGGLLQYSALNSADYSPRFSTASQPMSIDLNGQNVVYAAPLMNGTNGSLTIFDTAATAGSLTLNANSTFFGSTTLVNGTLRGTAGVSQSAVTSTLSACVWPGVSQVASAVPTGGETLTLGGLNLGGGKLKIALNTKSAASTQKLVVNGACDITGAMLSLGIPAGASSPNDYVVLSSVTPIVGSFSTVLVNGIVDNGTRVTVTKTANAVSVKILGGVTPVTVGSFGARPEGAGVLLDWVSLSEYQNAGFNVYRRIANSDSWERVNAALIAGRITNPESKEYQFYDWVNPGIYEYKLESVSIFGQAEAYSGIAGPVTVDSGASRECDVSLGGLNCASVAVELQTRMAAAQVVSSRLTQLATEESQTLADRATGGLQPMQDAQLSDVAVRSFDSGDSNGAPGAANGAAARASASAAPRNASDVMVAAARFATARPSASASSSVVKVVYDKAGVLFVPKSSLPAGFNLERLSIQREGRNVTALSMTADGLLLAAPGYEDDYTNKDVFFLRKSTAQTSAGAVAAAADLFASSLPVNAASPATVTVSYHDVYFDYDAAFRPYNFPPWFSGQYLTGGSAQRFALDTPSASGAMAALTVNLWSLTQEDALPADHALQVALNGQTIGQVNWKGGGKMIQFTFQVPANLLASGTNQVDLITPNIPGSTHQIALLHSLNVAYTRALDGSKPLDIFNPGSQAKLFEVGNLPTATAWVVDNRFADRAALVPYRTQQQADGTYKLRFMANGGGSGKYQVVPAGMENRPLLVSKSQLKALSASTYLAVGPAQFGSGVQPLLLKHRKEGMKTQFADQEQVFNYYNYGRYGPAGIQNAVRATRPQYLLLLGRTTYDYKNYGGQNVDPLCPAFLVTTSFWSQTTSDSLFGDLGRGYPEVAVGRLPVSNADELAGAVGHITGYKGIPASGIRVHAVADKPDAEIGDFGAQLDVMVKANHADLSWQENYLERTYATAPEVTAAMKTAALGGADVILYAGHGNAARLGAATPRILDQTLVQEWTGNTVFIQATCTAHWAAANVEGYKSIAIQALTQRQGGIAVGIGTSTYMNPDASSVFVNQLLANAGSGGARWGTALLKTQQWATREGGNSAGWLMDLARTEQLFGDPAMLIYSQGARSSSPHTGTGTATSTGQSAGSSETPVVPGTF